jgi:two-component system, OmpR family, sensor histidine kinase BaeS
MRHSFKRRGPAWWPEGEPWPPPRGWAGFNRRTRARFFRRLIFGGVFLLSIIIMSTFAAAWLIADKAGSASASAALVAMLLLFGAVALMLLVSGSLRRFASPLGAVMDAADRVADGDYGVRVQEFGAPTMRALARSFNTMTERLQNADQLRRNVMADVAHELRTPLSVLQGRLEGLIDGVYPRDDRQLIELLEETQVLSRLIDDLRTLALSDAGALPLQKEPTDLFALARDVVASMAPEADKKSVALSVTAATEATMVDVDPVRIREVLINLVSNAIDHSAAGSSVVISIDQTAGPVRVTVRDTGVGMSSDEVARMFDRFYKGAGSRGSGLGLAIVKSIVMAHGGQITASSEPGKGTMVEFTLSA